MKLISETNLNHKGEYIMNKMLKAQEIYDSIHTNGYDLKGKSLRQEFMDRAMNEAKLSKHGANSYYQNIRNERVHGKSLYEYNKSTDEDNNQSENTSRIRRGNRTNRNRTTEVKPEFHIEHSWVVMQGTQIVNSFKSQKSAKNYVQTTGGVIA